MGVVPMVQPEARRVSVTLTPESRAERGGELVAGGSVGIFYYTVLQLSSLSTSTLNSLFYYADNLPFSLSPLNVLLKREFKMFGC